MSVKFQKIRIFTKQHLRQRLKPISYRNLIESIEFQIVIANTHFNIWMISNYSNKSGYFSSRVPHSGNAMFVVAHTARKEIGIVMNEYIENRRISTVRYAEKVSIETNIDVITREFIPETQSLPRYQSKLVREKLLFDHQEMVSESQKRTQLFKVCLYSWFLTRVSL